MRDRALRWLVPAVIAACAVALVPSVLRPEEIPCGRDLLDFFLPMKAMAARSLLAGHVPWWDPFTLGGSPFVANLQSQVFYPPNWLFLVLPLGWGLSVFSALHLALAGIGALALARVSGRSLPAGLLAGVATTSCGFVVSLVDLSNQLCTVAWLPLACAAAVRHATSRSRLSLAAWASALVLAFLGGEPQMALAGGLLTVALAFGASNEPWRHGAARALGAGALAAVLALACAAVQLVPFAEMAARSDRFGSAPFADGGRNALDARAALALVKSPRGPFDAPAGPYVRSLQEGPMLLALALLALLRRERFVAVMAVATLASVLLAAAPGLPLAGPLVLRATPFLRYPIKHLVLAVLLAPQLAAAGLDLAAAWLAARGARGRIAAGVGAWAVPFVVMLELVPPQSKLLLALPEEALLASTPLIDLLAAQTSADGPRLHATGVTSERIDERAKRVLRGDIAGAERERVELLEGGLPALFEIHATYGAAAMTLLERAELLDRATGPAVASLAQDLDAGFLIADARRRLPLPELPIEGGAARAYVLPWTAPRVARIWDGPNVARAEPGMPPPSSFPGWKEGPPGTWTFRPRGLAASAAVSIAGWAVIAWLALSGRVGARLARG